MNDSLSANSSQNSLEKIKILQIAELNGYPKDDEETDEYSKIISRLVWLIKKISPEIEVHYIANANFADRFGIANSLCNAFLKLNCPLLIMPRMFQNIDYQKLLPIFEYLADELKSQIQ